MLVVGRNLQTPCLKPDQLLNRSRIARLFAQKNIWLKPVENIQLIDQCLTQITSKYLHELSSKMGYKCMVSAIWPVVA